MNQPQNPVPPRGVRPQLFNAPASTTANAKRHADFGPSILATIDGGQARFASSRDRLPARRALLIGALALMAAAAYLGVKLNGSRNAAAPEAVVVQAVSTAPRVKAIDAAPSSPQMAMAQGAAAIETVTPVVVAPASAPADGQPGNVAASLSNIQQALDRSEPAAAKKDVVVSKDVQAVRRAQPAATAARPSTRRAAPDDDADLLAAMLPHLKRSAVAPTSPAYEKRCGQLAAEAAADCRAKFCNGRQGADAACPAAQGR